MVDGSCSPWCKLPYAFTAWYFQACVHQFTNTRRLVFNVDKVDCEYHTLRKKYGYPRKNAYNKIFISEILSIKPETLDIGDIGAVRIYLQLKTKMENNKYVENEFALLRPPKGKHTMENIPTPRHSKPMQDDEEEDEEHEDSSGLVRRR